MESSISPLGLIFLRPKKYHDQRGFFSELYNDRRYKSLPLETQWVQDNLVFSPAGVLRGLHFQKKYHQAKLISVLQGKIFDVAVDLRPASKTFGQFWSGLLSADGQNQLYIPQGFAHGYQAVAPDNLIMYKCSDYYRPADEGGLIYDDPDLAISWPLKNPVLSPKDKAWPRFKELFKGEKT